MIITVALFLTSVVQLSRSVTPNQVSVDLYLAENGALLNHVIEWKTNEFWLGNDILRDLTGSGQWQLRVDIEDWEPSSAWASYGEFNVTGDKYTIHVGLYDHQSTAGDALKYHNGYPFTTKDQDNDKRSDNCAAVYGGAWWFNSCQTALLNSDYQQGNVINGRAIQWSPWKGSNHPLKSCSMKIRPIK
ncbi:techylectin-5B-like [Asterias amurensis]|uniref:techylectin-5B-like n=1 Tax=Asterias amurensis TaxID=7602 RepID=UPI003AB86F6B